jgi:uncharacterized protein YcbK (DUF882 family)
MPFYKALADVSAKGARSLSFNILHSGEKATVEYWADGNYLPDALERINYLLRDFRDGTIHVIDPSLLDLLVALRTRLESVEPFDIICGYRSPATNALLRSEYSGVAAKSLHLKGMAADICIAGRSLEKLHEAAVALRGGGVGYYPEEDFVHVDTGRVRYWSYSS